MKLDEYLELLRTRSVIGSRVIRVLDLTDHANYTLYNVILIPQDEDADSGVAYTIITEDREIQDRLVLWPSQFEMVSAWRLDNLVKEDGILKNFPINEIFEGVGDLLQRHGKTVLSSHDIYTPTSEIFVQYGDYSYKLCYREGVLYSIHRMEVPDNGKD